MEQGMENKTSQASFVQQLIIECKVRGVRMSSKRIQVAAFLERAGTYIDADELLLLMRRERIKISIPYVYQCLNWLVDFNFVIRNYENRKYKYCINPDVAAR